jgi:endonuclease/exonuclease/phosphatase family metal-dependent hydrolase
LNIELVSWNILADGYIRPKFYPHTDAAWLKAELRHPQLIAALIAQDADLYCLQEVEQALFDEIRAALEPLGYHAHLALKPGRAEGSALITRASALEVTRTHALAYDATSKGHRALALIAAIQPASGQPFVIVSTHLAWAHRSTPPAEHPGCLQLAQLLDARDAQEVMPAGLPWIICGDLNDEPGGPVLAIAKERGMGMPCAQQRPWHTVNINARLAKLDYALAEPHAPAMTPHQLPALTKTTPMPGPDHASDHLPLRMRLSC